MMSTDYWLGAISSLSSYLPGSTITMLKIALHLGTQFFSQLLSLLWLHSKVLLGTSPLSSSFSTQCAGTATPKPFITLPVYKAADSKASPPLLLPGSALSQHNRDPFCIQLNHLINYLWTKT